MKRDDWMLLILTFLTGLAIGMYIYITAFKPTYAPENLSNTESEASDWSLVGKKRSLDAEAGFIEPSFRLLGNGEYVYIQGGQDDDSLEPREGKLSSSLMRDLREYDDMLGSYTENSPGVDCASYEGGYDYEYRVTKDNVLYLLDTCDTMLGQDTPYATALLQVWEQIEGTAGSGLRYGNFSEWAEKWINDNFGVDRDLE